MKKLISTLVLSALCAPLFLSCSSDDGEKAPPDTSGLKEYPYCVFVEDKKCLGPAKICPNGGMLSLTCPYEGGGSSSSLGQSSSSGRGEFQVTGIFGKNNKFLDPRDGKEYSYIIAGQKVWMLQNLNYSKDETIGWCYGVDVQSEKPNRDSTSCGNGYGRVYDYSTAMAGNSPQGLCPRGWHIPSSAEWTSATGLPPEFYMLSGNYSMEKSIWKARGLSGFYWASGGTKNSYAYILCRTGNIGCLSVPLTTSEDPNPIRCVADETMECGYGKYYNPVTHFCSQNEIRIRCGSDAYNPEDEFCSGGKVYEKCRGEEYDPATDHCLSDIAFPKCGTTLYNPETHFCGGDAKIYLKCDGEAYNPATEGCLGGEVLAKCGDEPYNDAIHFCRSGVLYELCDGEEYDADTFCYGDDTYSKCGTKEYNPDTHFCSDTDVLAKCGGSEYAAGQGCFEGQVFSKCGAALYDPETHFCSNDAVVEKCGGSTYNPITYFCSGNAPYQKCGTAVYNPATQGCSGTIVLSKCGTALYNPATDFCSGGKVRAKCNAIIYDPAEDFCSGTGTAAKVLPLCGGKEYAPATEGCSGDEVRAKCGTALYDPEIYFCSGTGATAKVLPLCGGEKYDLEIEECVDGEIISTNFFKDSRDNKIYKQVKIGTQIWMAQNLDYYDASIAGIYCANCDVYGRLYTWAAAMNIASTYNSSSYTVSNPHQGICPSGWHLPSDNEWETLITYVGTDAGKKLSATSGWNTAGYGTDLHGFGALPGGNQTTSPPPTQGGCGNWWSTLEYSTASAYDRYICSGNSTAVMRSYYSKNSYFSVRCVKN